MTRARGPRELAGGPIAVRPPALVEAAHGVRVAAGLADRSAAELERCLGDVGVFGPAQGSFARMGSSWLADLRLLVRQAGELSVSVEAAAADYLGTESAVAGRVP